MTKTVQTSIGGDTELRNISIVISTNENYIRPTVVAMTSLFENAGPTTFYQVNVLIPGNLKNESKKKIGRLKERYGNCQINLIDMHNKYNDWEIKWYPAASYYYLESASLFPNLKKCLFLDGDVIVRHDLSELYNTDIDAYFVAAVFDYFQNSWMEDRTANAGVVLMNLENFRKNNLEDEFYKYAHRKDIRHRYGDQQALNAICSGKILYLPPKFNFLANAVNISEPYESNIRAKEISTQAEWEAIDPVIVHFAGGHKPWTDPARSIFHEEFWHYALLTKVYDENEKYKAIRMRHQQQQQRQRHKTNGQNDVSQKKPEAASTQQGPKAETIDI